MEGPRPNLEEMGVDNQGEIKTAVPKTEAQLSEKALRLVSEASVAYKIDLNKIAERIGNKPQGENSAEVDNSDQLSDNERNLVEQTIISRLYQIDSDINWAGVHLDNPNVAVLVHRLLSEHPGLELVVKHQFEERKKREEREKKGSGDIKKTLLEGKAAIAKAYADRPTSFTAAEDTTDRYDPDVKAARAAAEGRAMGDSIAQKEAELGRRVTSADFNPGTPILTEVAPTTAEAPIPTSGEQLPTPNIAEIRVNSLAEGAWGRLSPDEQSQLSAAYQTGGEPAVTDAFIEISRNKIPQAIKDLDKKRTEEQAQFQAEYDQIRAELENTKAELLAEQEARANRSANTEEQLAVQAKASEKRIEDAKNESERRISDFKASAEEEVSTLNDQQEANQAKRDAEDAKLEEELAEKRRKSEEAHQNRMEELRANLARIQAEQAAEIAKIEADRKAREEALNK